MKSARPTENRHLAVAVICSAALAYFVVSAFNHPLVRISYLTNDRWGSGDSMTGLFIPIGMMALGAYFSWRGYFEDRRIRLVFAARKKRSETRPIEDKPHPNKSDQPERAGSGKSSD
jgi:hypothetical protein